MMAVFTTDQFTADSYAHWMEHQAKPFLNVTIQPDVLSPIMKATLNKVDSNWHEETMAASELTQYVKHELPVKHHNDFKKFIVYANKPAALLTQLITEWKPSERIKDANTKRASPKSAMDFDTPMTEAAAATTNEEGEARSRFNPITTLNEWSEATPERMAEAMYLINPNYAADEAAKTAASKAAYEAHLAAKTAASTTASTNPNAATTTSNADHVSI